MSSFDEPMIFTVNGVEFVNTELVGIVSCDELTILTLTNKRMLAITDWGVLDDNTRYILDEFLDQENDHTSQRDYH